MAEQYKLPDTNYHSRLVKPFVGNPLLEVKTDDPIILEPVIQDFVYNYLTSLFGKNQQLTYEESQEFFNSVIKIKIGDRTLFTVHYANAENCSAFNIYADADGIQETFGLRKKQIIKMLENYGRIIHKNVPFDIGEEGIEDLIRKLRRKKGVEVVESDDGWEINSLDIGGGQPLRSSIADIVRTESGSQFVPMHQFDNDDNLFAWLADKRYSFVEETVKKYNQ